MSSILYHSDKIPCCPDNAWSVYRNTLQGIWKTLSKQTVAKNKILRQLHKAQQIPIKAYNILLIP